MDVTTRGDTDAEPTWGEFTTLLTEGTRSWLPDDLVAELLTYLDAAGRVVFTLVASSPPGTIVDTCIQANLSCLQLCVEGVEALGGLDLGHTCSKNVLAVALSYRPMFETIIAPMSEAAAVAVIAKYDRLGPLLATMTKAEDINTARTLLRMLTAGAHSIVTEIARNDLRWRGDGIGGGVGTPGWRHAQKRWAETGKWEADAGGRPGGRRA